LLFWRIRISVCEFARSILSAYSTIPARGLTSFLLDAAPRDAGEV
jgi:hypothetical protein